MGDRRGFEQQVPLTRHRLDLQRRAQARALHANGGGPFLAVGGGGLLHDARALAIAVRQGPREQRAIARQRASEMAGIAIDARELQHALGVVLPCIEQRRHAYGGGVEGALGFAHVDARRIVAGTLERGRLPFLSDVEEARGFGAEASRGSRVLAERRDQQHGVHEIARLVLVLGEPERLDQDLGRRIADVPRGFLERGAQPATCDLQATTIRGTSTLEARLVDVVLEPIGGERRREVHPAQHLELVDRRGGITRHGLRSKLDLEHPPRHVVARRILAAGFLEDGPRILGAILELVDLREVEAGLGHAGIRAERRAEGLLGGADAAQARVMHTQPIERLGFVGAPAQGAFLQMLTRRAGGIVRRHPGCDGVAVAHERAIGEGVGTGDVGAAHAQETESERQHLHGQPRRGRDRPGPERDGRRDGEEQHGCGIDEDAVSAPCDRDRRQHAEGGEAGGVRLVVAAAQHLHGDGEQARDPHHEEQAGGHAAFHARMQRIEVTMARAPAGFEPRFFEVAMTQGGDGVRAGAMARHRSLADRRERRTMQAQSHVDRLAIAGERQHALHHQAQHHDE